MKRGLLDVCVLAAVLKGDSYGYKIIKDISCCIKISESTLYPILKRLESSGDLTSYSIEHNGRLRRFYKITDIGRDKINEFLTSWDEIAGIYSFVKGESDK
jgi:PadR family transcriptional regulator PadR